MKNSAEGAHNEARPQPRLRGFAKFIVWAALIRNTIVASLGFLLGTVDGASLLACAAFAASLVLFMLEQTKKLGLILIRIAFGLDITFALLYILPNQASLSGETAASIIGSIVWLCYFSISDSIKEYADGNRAN